MHAASVHPEPGSNSQTNCISSAVAVRFLSELFILAFFTFLELCSLWFWQILYSHLLFCFVLLLSVVQLSSFNPLSLREPVYYITFIRACQEVFQKFFRFFSTSFLALSCDIFFSVALATTRTFYHTPSPLSTPFLKFFKKFFLLSFTAFFYAPNNRIMTNFVPVSI